MKNISFFFLFMVAALLFVGCEQAAESSGEEAPPTQDAPEATQPAPPETSTKFSAGGLTVYAIEDSPQFPEASLEMNEPVIGTDLEPGENSFDFTVSGYELGVPTPGAGDNGLANSGKGQHIHLIMNNGPYSAHYEPSFTKDLEEGHYVALAFLSRSFHESVKAPNAFAVSQFVVGTPANIKEANLSAPHLFYSRPKGSYYGEDTEKLLLDFFLVNCNLSPDGYKVRATINGNEFTFTKWVPYAVEGLKFGEVTVKLELLDKAGNLVESPFNPVERTVTLAEKQSEG
ncbi:MAG: phosphopeptide-binding protein [Bacteroidota bacterium]